VHKTIKRIIPAILATLLAACTLSAHAATTAGTLTDAALSPDATYNGIVIPSDHAFTVDPNNGFPVTVPYLLEESEGGYAPSLINIDRGRQLFVDDFLIEQTNLERVFYSALQNDEPVFAPETSFEISGRPSTAATSGERKTRWFVDNVIIYHRTFSEILNSLIQAGFVIEKMIEPLPNRRVT